MENSDYFVRYLTWEDYLVFSMMLGVSAAIGIFYGCFGNKMNNTKDFLFAGKSSGIFPVAMSLAVSFLSSITLLGGPSEVYQNGLVYWLTVFSFTYGVPIVTFFYLPVFWDLQLTSVYEYLEHRFSMTIRYLGSTIFIIQMVVYMVFSVYAPSLALSQMTQLTLYTSVLVMVLVCIFYTALGGIKAVLWTDVVQAMMMYVCLLFVYIEGTSKTGGISYIWNKSKEGGRTQLVDWDINPTTRHTFWTLVFGSTFSWINVFAVNQTQVQRYLCLRKKSAVVKAIVLGSLCRVSYTLISCYGGLVIYTRYGDCDPVKSGKIHKNDQLFPLFVMDILGDYPGVPGLLIAGIFAGSLSTVSSGLNSLAAITLEDFIKKKFPSISDYTATIISKVSSVCYGFLTLGLIAIVEHFGNILEASISVFGMLSGPHLGLFTLGMFFPWTNSIGAGIGVATGLAASLWVGIGYRVAVATKQYFPKKLAISVLGCNFTNSDIFSISSSFNATMRNQASPERGDILSIYRMSYLWYSGWGFLITIAVGLLVSFATGQRRLGEVNPRLLSPLSRKMCEKLSKTRGKFEEDREIEPPTVTSKL